MANSAPVVLASDQSALPITDNSGSLTVDGTVAVSTINSVAPAFGTGARGATVQRVTIATDDVVPVTDNGGSLTVDNGGTFAVQATIAAGATAIAKAEDVASADADVGVPALAVRKATPANTSGTDGDYEFLQMSAGRLWASATIDAALPAGANAIGKLAANDGVDVGDVTVNNASGASAVNVQDGGNSLTVDYATTGSGNATGALRVELANNGTGVLATVGAVTAITNALPAGTNAIGKLAANSGVIIGDVNVVSEIPGTGATALGKAEDAASASGDTGVAILAVRETTPTDLSAGNTDGDYEPLEVNRDGALWVAGAASHKGGWSIATGTIAATKTDIGTANTAGQVGGWYFYNANASVAYVQFFNAQASAVTLGTTAPVYSLGIPATSAANVAPGMVGLNHATAISIAVTTTRSGSTGPGSTVDYNIWFKQ